MAVHHLLNVAGLLRRGRWRLFVNDREKRGGRGIGVNGVEGVVLWVARCKSGVLAVVNSAIPMLTK